MPLQRAGIKSMADDDLDFLSLSERILVKTRVFDLVEAKRQDPNGEVGDYVLVRAPQWVNTIGVVPNAHGVPCFLMVRQFRHGIGRSVWEFPGGMVDDGEDLVAAVARELEEETGWRAGTWTKLGSTNPNPSFMTNACTTFEASHLEPTGTRNLDSDEFVRVGLRPVTEVLAQVGEGEYNHGIMMMALWFWLRRHPEVRF